MSRKHKPRNEAKPRNAGLLTLIEKASRLKASHLKRLESVPRDPTEAYAWLKQLAGELLDLREKMIEEFRRSAETALHDAVPVWVEPWLVSPHLIKWVTDAVKAYAREGSAKGKSRRSMDAALGLKPSRGAPRDPQGAQAKIAIQIDDLKRERKSGNEIASALGIDNVRTIQRIFKANPDVILKHRISHVVYSAPLGYDLKDGKLIVNEREAAIVRMIFQRYAQLGSASVQKRARIAVMRKLKAKGVIDEHGKLIDKKHDAANARTILDLHVQSGLISAMKRSFTALVRKLKTEGVTDKQGKPSDKVSLHRLLNNRVYIGEGRGEPGAIIDRKSWREVRRISRAVVPYAVLRGAQKRH